MVFLKKHSVQQISSIPSHLADSPRATEVLTQGSFCDSHGSSSQLPWTPVGLHPCPRYEMQKHGLSIWLSLHSDGHRLVGLLPNSFKWLPFQWTAMDTGISPLRFSSLSTRCSLVPLALFLLSPLSSSLLSFVLLSSVWLLLFLLSSQAILPVFTSSSVRTAASLDILDALVERVVSYFQLLLRHLVHPYLCIY